MAKKDLAAELAELNTPTQAKPADAVENENVEAEANTPAPPILPTVTITSQPEEPEPEVEAEPEEEFQDESALYWEGIIHPDYRLKTIYLPINNAPSKANGYDPVFGESYVYTPVAVMHKPPGCENHRRDVFNVRVDCRVVVPSFVASQLGERVDAQDYFD